MSKYIQVDIEESLYERFQIALKLSGDIESAIVPILIRKYCADILNLEVARLLEDIDLPIPISCDEAIPKALTKIPLWARKPEQFNHKILRAFLACRKKGEDYSLKSEMQRFFQAENPSLGNERFINNFNSMCTDAGNAHGKVFDCIGEIVEINPAIKAIVEQYTHYFWNIDKMEEDEDGSCS